MTKVAPCPSVLVTVHFGSMVIEDIFGNCQTKPGALVFITKEGEKYLINFVRGNPDPIVHYLQSP